MYTSFYYKIHGSTTIPCWAGWVGVGVGWVCGGWVWVWGGFEVGVGVGWMWVWVWQRVTALLHVSPQTSQGTSSHIHNGRINPPYSFTV